MKWNSPSLLGDKEQKRKKRNKERKKGWIRATVWESLHLQLCLPATGMKTVVCSVSPSNVCSPVCAERPCICMIHTKSLMTFFSHLLHELFFNTAVLFQGRVTVNEKCQGWCLKSALWAYVKKDFKKEAYLFCNFVHRVLKLLLMSLLKCHLWDTVLMNRKVPVMHKMW